MKLKLGSWSLTPYLMVVLFLGLQACGGGGGDPVPETNTSLASEARGYYDGFATIDFATGELNVAPPNLKAIVDEKEFVITFVGTPNLLYKGTFTEVTSTTFKADIRVYKDQVFFSTAKIDNGTITAGTSFMGTISGGTGDYSNSVGNIELTYNGANDLVAKEYMSGGAAGWIDSPLSGVVTFNSSTNLDVNINTVNNSELLDCDTTGGFDTANVVYAQTGRIHSFTTSPMEACSEGTPPTGKVLNGYLTNYNGNGVDDDRMLFVASDDELAYVAILFCGNNPAAPVGQCLIVP